MPRVTLPTTVKTLGWISFWADVSSELAYPILPLFMVGTLNAPSWTLGLMEGLAGLVIALLRLWSGIQSDKIGRRVPYIRWGYGLSVLAKPLVGLAANWPTVLVCRLADRVGKGIRTSSRDALIADAVDPSISGRAFGFHRMMDTAGAFVGVCIGASLIWKFPHALRTILLLTAFPGLIAVAITFLVKENKSHHAATQEKARTAVNFHLPKQVWGVLVVLGLFGFANSSDTYLLLFAGTRGVAPYQVILLYALYNLTYALSSSPFGSASDRVGSGKILLLGWALFGISYIVLAGSSGLGMVGVFAIYGVSVAATDGVSNAFLVQQGSAIPKGTLIGTHYFILGLTTLAGNLVAGLIWAFFSPQTMLVFGGILAILSSIALGIYLKHHREPRHS